MSLQDTDIEVLSWVLTQGISGPYADTFSACIVERGERPQDPTPQTGQPEHAAGVAPEVAATSRVPESPREEQEVLNKKDMRPVEMQEKDRLLAHFKAGFTAILNGKREPFQDKQVMKALPGAVKKLYLKEKFGTAKQIIERLAAELISKDSAVRGAVAEALSLSLEAVPPELRVHTTREVEDKLASWIKSEASVSAAYERTSVLLEKVAKMLLGQREYHECIPILEAFALTRPGKPKKGDAKEAVADRFLKDVGAPDLIELLVKDFRATAEGKSEHAGRCLAILGVDVGDHLLDALLETRDKPEQMRLIEGISEMGESVVPALNDRIKQGGPSHFMCALTLLAGRIGHESHIGPLEELLSFENGRVREEALNSICHISGERAGRVLLSQLANADDVFKIKIVAVLGAKKYQIAVKPLIELLQDRPSLMTDERDDLEERICMAFGQIGSEEAIPTLTSIVKQNKFFVTKPYNKKVKAAANKAIEEIIANQYK
jgi:hypothetical protein